MKNTFKGYIVDATYRIENDESYIYLFGRLENGKAFVTKNKHEAKFYIKKTEQEKAGKLLQKKEHKIEDTAFKDPQNESVVAIVTKIPSNVPDYRSILESNDITCYEADIRFVRTFLMTKKIRGHIIIEGTPEEINQNTLMFNQPELNELKERPTIKLKTISIDIETSPDAKELYCMSIYDNSTEKYHNLIISSEKVEGAENFEDTTSLLKKYEEIIQELDPDIITGWNVVDFDLAMIRDYSRSNNYGTKIGRLGWNSELNIQKDFLRTSKAQVPGRSVLDGLELLRNSFISLESYTLGNAAKEILGEEKLIASEDRRNDIKDLYHHDKKKLVEYNQKDSKLAYDIIAKLDLISLSYERTLITGLLLDEIRGAIASFDALYLRELHDKNIVYYSVPRRDRTARIKGGFVMESKPGLYKNTLVLDFKSLYPSIIATFNIDPMTYDEKGTIEAPNHAKFLKSPEGILPQIITYLSNMRDEAKKENNKTASFALKTTMNSLFGVLANPQCRFYSLEVANAITYFGQKLIQDCAKLVENEGHQVIYSDTDSLFVHIGGKDKKYANERGNHIAKSLNETLKNEIKTKYDRESKLILQFEKHYSMFWMPTTRKSEEGSKKRYAGLLENDEINIVGLEYVRRDWTQAARDFQYQLLEILFSEKDPTEFIRTYIQDLKDGKFDAKLVYRKSLRKNVKDYTKTTPPHVKAARKLDKVENRVIEYYMTKDGPEPLEKLTSEIDYEHYVEKQIKPLAEAVLSALNLKFDDVLNNSKQKTLSGW